MTAPQTILTPQQIDEIREELRRSLARLERSVRTNGNGRTPDLDQSAVGRLSRIEALQNQGMTQNIKDRERVQLEQVLKALERFPLLITAGGALLGWIAGEVIVTDPVIVDWVAREAHYLHDWRIAAIAGAVFVIVTGIVLRRVIKARRRQKLDLVS